MQERLITDFPHILLENCSGGGARFDPGMLYYSPQIWCSDDTDAVERLMIQEGTAMVYPLSAMGAHVSVCPNHTVGRVTPFETRGYVALAGTFGYELDITKLSEEDKDSIKHQVELYHRYNDLVRTGTYYRLASYGDNHEFDAWQVSSKDGTKALVTYVQVLSRPNQKSRIIKVQGLKENVSYRVTLEGSNSADDMKLYSLRLFSGSMLMNGGLVIRNPWGDFQSKLIYIEAVE
jgi:alpha-galactosidase